MARGWPAVSSCRLRDVPALLSRGPFGILPKHHQVNRSCVCVLLRVCVCVFFCSSDQLQALLSLFRSASGFLLPFPFRICLPPLPGSVSPVFVMTWGAKNELLGSSYPPPFKQVWYWSARMDEGGEGEDT